MKYILGVIGMIIFGVIAVILFARSIDSNNQSVQKGIQVTHTTDYINDRSKVIFTREGSVVGNEEHRTLKITVSERERVFEIFKGYEGTIETRKTYKNNPDAYYVFMNSLDKAGFTREQRSKVDNPTGICPKGSTYFYTLKDINEDVTNLWNSSCQTLGGTLGNNGAAIRSLFTSQIPNYSQLISDVDF